MHNDNVSYENEVKTCFIFTKIVSICNNYDGVTDDDEKEGRWTFPRIDNVHNPLTRALTIPRAPFP